MLTRMLRGLLMSIAPPTTPTVPGDDGRWKIPAITPDFNAPGVAGLTAAGNSLAGVALVSAGIAIVLGALIAALGPRLGFMHAKGLGVGGILGGLAIGAVVAMATPAVATVGAWFA